ncbi:MAG TPA: 2OG-Fe(II) oxygenase [Acidimicrobiales bacterium]|nr:2OG-Fe(II) oxygenase [Acidimicrobiales bacterium]
MIDGFLDRDSAEAVARELEATDTTWWHRDDHPDQVAKQWMDDPSRLPPSTAEALRFMNSPSACDFLSVLTGIGDLRPDDSYLGGGVHVTSRGGRLGVHSDFNIHPQSKLHRRVNALLFLNRDWDPLWQGQLELWSKTLDEVSVSVDPNLNRLVVFTITDDAFHGVPTPLACPPDRHRFSLALYYYTADRPEHEKAPFHWAAWQAVART